MHAPFPNVVVQYLTEIPSIPQNTRFKTRMRVFPPALVPVVFHVRYSTLQSSRPPADLSFALTLAAPVLLAADIAFTYAPGGSIHA